MKATCDEALSNFAFNFNSRRYVVDLSAHGSTSDIVFDPSAPSLFAVGCDDPVGRCMLTL
jgi:WD repeat-containing protein 42A